MLTVAGEHTLVHEFITANGCDSIITLNLTVNEPSQVSYEVTLCQGEALNIHGFDTLITEVGTHTLVHQSQNVNGCDSITTLTLTVNSTFSKDTVVNICDVDIPFYWNDNETYRSKMWWANWLCKM